MAGMKEVLIAACLAVVLMIGVYVVGYFVVPKRRGNDRVFPEWAAHVYAPAVNFEEFVTGERPRMRVEK